MKELQEIVGGLNMACRVVAPGCVLRRRLGDTMKCILCPFHRTRVKWGMMQDLQVWSQFLVEFSGISFQRSEISLKAEFQVQTDAAASLALGSIVRAKGVPSVGLRIGFRWLLLRIGYLWNFSP